MQANNAIRGLRKEIDYTVDEKSRSCALSEEGITKIEKRLGIENLFAPDSFELVHVINQALRAHVLFRKDDHYIVQNGQIIIVAPQLTTTGNITVTAGATSGNTTTLDVLGTTGTGRVTFSCSTTAPKASCVVTSNDSVNNHTVDFSNSNSASATVTVSTTANTRRGGHPNGTTPGTYTVTVNAFTESSSDATKPSASTNFNLTVN